MNDIKIPLLTEDLDFISKLSDRPNQTEPDELTPEEFKAEFDKAGNRIKDYVNNVLLPAIIAQNVPFASSTGNVNGTTVLEAIEWLKSQMAESQLGQIGDKTITEEKLTDDVVSLLHIGEPVVRSYAPSAEKFAVGQIWLHTSNGTANGVLEGLYIQVTDNGDWKQYAYGTLPVTKGGTGKETFGVGKLLYGNGTELAELAVPTDGNYYLAFENGRPVWKASADIGDMIERIKTKFGSYDGNGKPREIDLEVTPKAVFIINNTALSHSVGNSFSYMDHAYVLVQDQIVTRKTSDTTITANPAYTKDSVKLNGNKLVFFGEKGSSAGLVANDKATCGNYTANNYTWVAIY